MQTTHERPLGLLEKYQVSKQLTRSYGTVTATAILRHSPRQPSNGSDDLNQQRDIIKQFYLSQLHAPIKRLVEKHVQLSLAVAEKDKPTAHFVRLEGFDLSSIVQVNEQQVPFWDRSELAKVISKECDHDFDLNNHTIPLWHFRICVHEDRLDECSITFTAHHVIVDGKSLALFWQDLYKEINRSDDIQKENQDGGDQHYWIKPQGAIPLMPPYEDRKPPMPTAWNMVGVISRMVAKKVLPGFLAQRWFPQGWAGDYPGVADKTQIQHHTFVRAVELGGTIWNNVCVACREHGVTPHAATMAALVLAFAEVYPEVKTVSTCTPLNCRPFCDPPVPEDEMGNFFGAYSHAWTLPPPPSSSSSENFWDMAKAYQTQLRANKYEGAKEAGLLKYLPKYPEDYCEFWYGQYDSNPSMHRAGGIELSDLGKFSASTTTTTTQEESGSSSSSWQIQSIWFCQSAHPVTTALDVNSIRTQDSIYLTLGWQKGSLQESKADALGPLVIDKLTNCFL